MSPYFSRPNLLARRLSTSALLVGGVFLGLTALSLTTALGQTGPSLPQPTIIECAGLSELISTDTETTATFSDSVVVTGNNLSLHCDFLKVVATRKADSAATLGQYGHFKSLVATGNVRIVQGDREAVCDRAEVFPGEDRIVLSGSPVVRSLDGDYAASGPRLILYRGQRRAVIEGTAQAPARITLPPIKDLGFDEETTTPSAATAVE